MPVRLVNARDTIPGHILTLTCVPSLDVLRLDGPPCLSVLTLHWPMSPSRAGRQQGQAGILCLTSPCSCSTVRVAPMQAKGAPQPQSDSITAFPSSASNCLGSQLPPPSTSADRSKGRRRQDPLEDSPPSPWNHYLYCRTSSARRDGILHPVPRRIFKPLVCPSLGARLTPVALYSISLHVAIRHPDRHQHKAQL